MLSVPLPPTPLPPRGEGRQTRRPLRVQVSVVQPRNAHPALAGAGSGTVVAGIDVADDTHARVAGQDALEAFLGSGGAIGDDDHAGVQTVADAHAATVVDAHPGSAAGGVDQGVED